MMFFMNFLFLFLFGYFSIESKDYFIDHQSIWNKTNYLTRSNWTSSISSNPFLLNKSQPVWFIFYYLSYCGYCQRSAPSWEDISKYTTNWSNYIRFGAYDCSSELLSMTDICQDDKYPQWRIYCPLTNSTRIGFPSTQRKETTTIKEIFFWLLTKLNKIAHQCYGISWPIQESIQLKSDEKLNDFIPKSVKQFQLFISNNSILYTLYVLNNSINIENQPIYHLLADHHFSINKEGIWKGIRMDNDQISLQWIEDIKSIEFSDFNQTTTTNRNEIIKIDFNLSTKPSIFDIDSSVIWMLTKDLRRKLPMMTVHVKHWLQILFQFYPGSLDLRILLNNLIDLTKNQTIITSNQFQYFIYLSSSKEMPRIKFDYCLGSRPSYRGYPCTLWILFHSMTVKQAILAENNQIQINTKPADLIISIRNFVDQFFQCEECTQHFLNMTKNAQLEINNYQQAVLYLWKCHNKVNQRLRYETKSNDPLWPKVPFPKQSQCYSCVIEIDQNGDAIQYDENEVYRYLKEFYNVIE